MYCLELYNISAGSSIISALYAVALHTNFLEMAPPTKTLIAMAHLAYLRRGIVGHERLLRSSHLRASARSVTSTVCISVTPPSLWTEGSYIKIAFIVKHYITALQGACSFICNSVYSFLVKTATADQHTNINSTNISNTNNNRRTILSRKFI